MVCYRRDDKSSRPNNHKKKSSPTFRSIVAIFHDQGQVDYHNDTTYTSDHHGGILRSPASSAPAPARRTRFGAAHNPGENTLARQPGTFRNGNRQLDGGTAPSTTLSGGTYFGFRRCSCSVAASLSSNAAQIASVKSPRAPTPSANESHSVVPAAGTSASTVVSSSKVIFFSFFLFRRRERAISATFPSVMV